MLWRMVTLKSRLGDWDLEHVQAWSDRQVVIGAPAVPLIGPTTKVATIGSCFASELAAMMDHVGVVGAMHPGGLFYSTATIRQELERIAGGWPERAAEPLWPVGDGWVDPFRDYNMTYPSEAVLLQERATADIAAEALFRDAEVVVVTLGLIEIWRSRHSGSTYRQIPHPAPFPTLGAALHRLTVTEMLDDLERGVRMPNSPSVIRLVSKVLDLPADKLITAGGLGDTADPALQTAAVRFVSRMQQVPEHLSLPEREALTEFIGTLAAK